MKKSKEKYIQSLLICVIKSFTLIEFQYFIYLQSENEKISGRKPIII